MPSLRFFSEEEVRARLPMADLINAMERALVESLCRTGAATGANCFRVRRGTLAFWFDAVVCARASGAGREAGDGVCLATPTADWIRTRQ